MNIKKLKDKIPYSIKQGLEYLHGIFPIPLRYGRVFRQTRNFLQQSQWWNKEKIEEYQIQQLELLLNHAYENVPYYTTIFDERHLKPKDIKCFDDLRKLPYLTKDDIRNNFAGLIDKTSSKSKLRYVTTSGSTGIPVGLYWEKGITDAKELAFVWRQWNWAGFEFGEKRVVLRGNVITKFKNGKRQVWEYSPIDHALILSSYDTTQENLRQYFNLINKFKPRVIRGYPSSLYTFANFLRINDLRLNGVKCVFTSSENLYPFQRELIEECFSSKIYDHYGNTECSALVMQCEHGGYHVIPEYGILELIGEKETLIEEGGTGEIVATGFNNYAMPLIRYKTGDMAGLATNKCLCGRDFPLVRRIEGRQQEYVVTKNGSLISFNTALCSIHDEKWANVKKIQCIQKVKGELIIHVVGWQSGTGPDLAKYILELFNERLGSVLTLEVKLVEDIPPTESGKHKYLIQELPILNADVLSKLT
jgi:phenylacetate-CoA ligase